MNTPQVFFVFHFGSPDLDGEDKLIFLPSKAVNRSVDLLFNCLFILFIE